MTSPALSPMNPHRTRRPGLLIGDTERDHTCQALASHFAAGRLTADELDQRVDTAMNARTNVELHLLTADLPTPGQAPATPPSTPVVQPVPQASISLATLGHGLLMLITLAAVFCTSLLLFFGLFIDDGFGVVWLPSLGTAVSVAGSMYYLPRLFRDRRSTPVQ